MKKVMILGSGGLRIGQAGEFDYSGSQALKALREEGMATVLVNPNVATIQTDGRFADRIYFQPLNVETVAKIIARERPQDLLLSFGGQTALNVGLALHDEGVLKKYRLRVLGTPIRAIRITEDRALFQKALDRIGVKTPRGIAAYSVSGACRAAAALGYPVMLRAGFSLGGLGSGKISTEAELKDRVRRALQAAPQVLIEEYVGGWKEIEYEIVRDHAGNIIAVCNMENMDPMGIHTGESIVVAPSQTLTNDEYHRLRAISLKVVSHLQVVGECNIQFALNPKTGDYRVIEVNARLSRSSALASKATGYPLAFVAAKLALGKKLYDLKNSVTGTTPALYEPALDYLAVKMPRWDLTKFKTSDRSIGSEMKSVGEVMALGRSFPEALQKAVRMLNIGAAGLSHHPFTFTNPLAEAAHATDGRLFAIYEAVKQGVSLNDLQKLSKIDKWFLAHVKDIADFERRLKKNPLSTTQLREAKQKGFSDKVIALLKGITEEEVRHKRLRLGITPFVKQIDTVAGEFASQTNYLYTTYHGNAHDLPHLPSKPVIILGSGPYCIGSSVEFDWCAVNTAFTLRDHGVATILINSNPETVSTDFDSSDRLYFEELTLERIRDIADFERAYAGIVVSVGGQIANNVALPLAQRGYRLLGTSAESIDRAENRQKFSSMLGVLGIDQPEWEEVTSLKGAKRFARKVGYPILIRPSYVLSGGAMNVVTGEAQLESYLEQATRISPDHPVVISRFITNAKELEIDGVAAGGEIVIYAISEHVENAGIHSGDATVVLPPQRLFLETIRRAKQIAKQITFALNLTGPFNVQFIAKNNEVKVIECNVRASRSFPFVSKVTGQNFISIATEAMLGLPTPAKYQTLELDHVGVKSPQFSYTRLTGADPLAGVEMASTGEVACLGDNLLEAFYMSWLATEQKVTGKRLLLSIDDQDKPKIVDEARTLGKLGWHIFATTGTQAYLKQHGVRSTHLYRLKDRREPSFDTVISKRKVDLIINVPPPLALVGEGDAYRIRRLAIDNHIPLVTNAEVGKLLLRCLSEIDLKKFEPKSWQEFMEKLPSHMRTSLLSPAAYASFHPKAPAPTARPEIPAEKLVANKVHK
ncbi:MAG: carbamoyl-phosphate synthase (glutamine-hydrolyzing) large subunit [Patescibacteria group bacterium]